MVEPRIRHLPPSDSGDELGKRAVDLCGEAGLELDDWQAYVLTESLKMKGDKFAAQDVGVNVSRQNGKGGIIEARLLTSVFLLKDALSIYSAHLYDTSMEAFRRMRAIVEDSPKLRSELAATTRSDGILRTHGAEGFEFEHNRRVRFRTRSGGAGRGWTGDLIVFDEAMILPEHFVAAALPALSGRSMEGNPQRWWAGSAVDQEVHDHGIVWARIRKRALEPEAEDRLAYFEWSIEGTNPDLVMPDVLHDRAAWAAANPALGVRIDPDYVASELPALGARSFAVERLGVGDWPRTDFIAHNPIDFEEWMKLADELVIDEPQVVAFDVSPERKSAVVIAGRTKEGFTQGELVESKGGTAWVAPDVAKLCKKFNIPAVCDGRGPAASLVPELRDLDIAVEQLNSSEHAQACGHLLDGVQRRTIRHMNDGELNGAVRAASTRPLGDAWAWSRKDSATNIAPLVAFTLGVSAAMTREKPRKTVMAWA